MLGKAGAIEVDEMVIDLEDAVTPSQKDAARALVAEWLAEPAGPAAVAVRVNRPGSPWFDEDLEVIAAAAVPPRSIVIPKVESAAELEAVVDALAAAEAAGGSTEPIGVQALIETAAGLARAEEIGAASPRILSLILGYADLAASLGRAADTLGRIETWAGAQERVLLAARVSGLEAVDGPWFDVRDQTGLGSWARTAAAAGFDGKWAIHPAQIDPIMSAFTPAEADVERAMAVLACLERHAEERGAGAALLDGEMVDEAMAAAARRLLRRAGERR
jgi:citrate lyase subunit beta/citryl-CoA lyase